MFSKDIVESDAFLDMSRAARILYFQFNLAADDDGFVGKVKRIIRAEDATADEYKELLDKRFVIEFPSGIVAIKHWWINNDIKKDRYHKTKYTKELELLDRKENGAYTEKIEEWIQLGYKMYPELDTQYRIDIGKDSIGNTTGPGLAFKKSPRGPKSGGARQIGEIINEKTK